MEILGKKVKDKVTGFEGIAIGITKYLYGCDVVGVTPAVDKDGKTGDTCWFDEGRIEIIGEGIEPTTVQVDKNGAGEMPRKVEGRM